MTVIPAGYAQINLRFSGAALPNGAEVTFGLDVSGFATGPAALGTGVVAAWVTNIMPNLANEVAGNGCLVKYGPESTGPSATVAFNSAGTAGIGAYGANCAWLVHKTTAFGGRAGRGRMYIPGLRETIIEGDGDIDGAARTNMDSDMTAFMTALDALPAPMVVLHSEGSPLTVPTPVTELVVDSRMATQRRRLRR